MTFIYAQETDPESQTGTLTEVVSEQAGASDVDSSGGGQSVVETTSLSDDVSDNGDDETGVEAVEVDAAEPADVAVDSVPDLLDSGSTTSVSSQSDSTTDSPTAAGTASGTSTATSTQEEQALTSDSDASDSLNDVVTSTEQATSSSLELVATTTTTTNTQQGSTTLDQSDDDSDSGSGTVGSTTSAVVPTEPTAVSVVQTDNVFAFNKNECTEVEDG